MPGAAKPNENLEDDLSTSSKINDHDGHDLGGDDNDSRSANAATEAAAAKKGWVPKDQYEGDASKWVDAATFIERGNNFNSVLQKRVKSLESELNSFKGTAEAFKKFHREAMEGKQRELDSALKALKAQHREAIRDGDDDAADALEGRMTVLTDEKAAVAQSLKEPPKQEDAPSAKTQELSDWVEADNAWFEEDLPMQKYALALAEDMIGKGEKARGRAFLDKIAAQVREDFPHKFGNPRRNRPGTAESGSGALKTQPGRSAKDLPEEDQKLMKEFVAAGWTTEEKFLKDYRWG